MSQLCCAFLAMKLQMLGVIFSILIFLLLVLLFLLLLLFPLPSSYASASVSCVFGCSWAAHQPLHSGCGGHCVGPGPNWDSLWHLSPGVDSTSAPLQYQLDSHRPHAVVSNIRMRGQPMCSKCSSHLGCEEELHQVLCPATVRLISEDKGEE